MLTALGANGGASLPLLAILGAVGTGLLAVKIEPLYAFLQKVESRMGRAGPKLAYVLVPVIFLLGQGQQGLAEGPLNRTECLAVGLLLFRLFLQRHVAEYADGAEGVPRRVFQQGSARDR